MAKTPAQVLAIFYSTGGLGDVGRHALRAALDLPADQVSSIKVLTQHPAMLEEANWKCGCPNPHEFTKEELERFQVIPIVSWSDDISKHLENVSAVVSCLGNRQPFHGERVGTEGTKAVVKAMEQNNISRVVVMSSVGVGDDWPPAEWHWGGKLMKWMFLTVCRPEYNDLTGVEQAIEESTAKLNYLFVKPVGLGEGVLPVGNWFIQKQKHQDTLGINMAKLDCARFMVQEALNPTRDYQAVVIGADPDEQG